MKKFFLILSFMVFSTAAFSQVLITLLLGDKLNSDKLKFGLEGGMNWATISGLETSESARFFNLGFYFDIHLKNQWRLYTGTLVKANLGVDKLTTADLELLKGNIYGTKGNYKQISNIFLVPIFLKYDFKNDIYLEAGPQLGLNYKDFIEFTSNENGTESRIRQYNDDMFHKIDGGFALGCGYTFLKGKGVTIGAKYYHGLTEVYKGLPDTRNRSFNLKANIRIGAKKAEARRNNQNVKTNQENN